MQPLLPEPARMCPPERPFPSAWDAHAGSLIFPANSLPSDARCESTGLFCSGIRSPCAHRCVRHTGDVNSRFRLFHPLVNLAPAFLPGLFLSALMKSDTQWLLLAIAISIIACIAVTAFIRGPLIAY
jgi:hypothetical protein